MISIFRFPLAVPLLGATTICFCWFAVSVYAEEEKEVVVDTSFLLRPAAPDTEENAEARNVPVDEANMNAEVAVKAFLAQSIGQSTEARLRLSRATLKTVNAALETEPHRLEHHLLKVAALGAVARATPFSESLKNRYGSRSRRAVNDMLTLAPDNPWAQFFAGIWHLEVDRRGGMMGSLFLGGSVKEGTALIEGAIERLSNEPGLPFAYAVVLLASNPDKNLDLSKKLLDPLRGIDPSTGALEKIVKEQAAVVYAFLEANDLDKAKAYSTGIM